VVVVVMASLQQFQEQVLLMRVVEVEQEITLVQRLLVVRVVEVAVDHQARLLALQEQQTPAAVVELVTMRMVDLAALAS
jgi:DNA-binding transcriptional regulator/RsmH inhibitor MraZ